MENYGSCFWYSIFIWCIQNDIGNILMMSKHIFTLLHWTWQLPQTLIGWFVYQYIKFKDKNCIIDECTHKSGHYAVMVKSEGFPSGYGITVIVFISDFIIFRIASLEENESKTSKNGSRLFDLFFSTYTLELIV